MLKVTFYPLYGYIFKSLVLINYTNGMYYFAVYGPRLHTGNERELYKTINIPRHEMNPVLLTKTLKDIRGLLDTKIKENDG